LRCFKRPFRGWRQAIILPDQFYILRLGAEVGTLSITLTRHATAGRTNKITLLVKNHIILIAAITAEIKNPFTIIRVFMHFSRRVPTRLLFDLFYFLLNAQGDLIIFFAATSKRTAMVKMYDFIRMV
jgi:hypothetical protein